MSRGDTLHIEGAEASTVKFAFDFSPLGELMEKLEAEYTVDPSQEAHGEEHHLVAEDTAPGSDFIPSEGIESPFAYGIEKFGQFDGPLGYSPQSLVEFSGYEGQLDFGASAYERGPAGIDPFNGLAHFGNGPPEGLDFSTDFINVVGEGAKSFDSFVDFRGPFEYGPQTNDFAGYDDATVKVYGPHSVEDFANLGGQFSYGPHSSEDFADLGGRFSYGPHSAEDFSGLGRDFNDFVDYTKVAEFQDDYIELSDTRDVANSIEGYYQSAEGTTIAGTRILVASNDNGLLQDGLIINGDTNIRSDTITDFVQEGDLEQDFALRILDSGLKKLGDSLNIADNNITGKIISATNYTVLPSDGNLVFGAINNNVSVSIDVLDGERSIDAGSGVDRLTMVDLENKNITLRKIADEDTLQLSVHNSLTDNGDDALAVLNTQNFETYSFGSGIDIAASTLANDNAQVSVVFGSGRGDDIDVSNTVDSNDNSVGSVILAGDGTDNITGSNKADIIADGNGNDVVKAGGGDDIIHGGLGNDTYIFEGSFGDDQFIKSGFGDSGDDTILFKGIAANEVTASADGSNLVLTHGEDSLTIADFFLLGVGSANTNVVDEFQFDNNGDGIVDQTIAADDITARELPGTLQEAGDGNSNKGGLEVVEIGGGDSGGELLGGGRLGGGNLGSDSGGGRLGGNNLSSDDSGGEESISLGEEDAHIDLGEPVLGLG